LLAAGGDVCFQAWVATLHHRTNTESCLLISNIHNALLFLNQKQYIRLLQADFFTLSAVTYRVRGDKASSLAINCYSIENVRIYKHFLSFLFMRTIFYAINCIRATAFLRFACSGTEKLAESQIDCRPQNFSCRAFIFRKGKENMIWLALPGHSLPFLDNQISIPRSSTGRKTKGFVSADWSQLLYT
jgi:hypothetical protein